MSKITIISPKEMVSVLKQLGFEEIRQTGSHKLFNRPDGRNTVIPMHSKDLKRGLIKAILKDIGLSIEDYERIRKN
ncbi:MAG: type II toxin-antitoxin system HicA family toxin [Syntrophomonas sp.]|uniref:type II toxin-antitoxin system HicA family toxin n=1 Tax=Syntrophomonas sp. TaxID=2053627 RepID=UPI002629C53A|nr:type II toxin-antitoxin system HicA family toxin [Syntrophomonas sp.]MDD4627717.1 type II toxin-antitoxin system HicA family toxin [Syntrophomonas sp.]